MKSFCVNAAGWLCQILGTLFLLLDSIRVGARLPAEGMTLGDSPALAKWHYQWASAAGFTLLFFGFVLTGIGLWMSRPRAHAASDAAPAPPPLAAHAGSSGQPDEKQRELAANYWLKRLDHTLTHTQTSSRLIYLVDGAVLALIYFSVHTLGASRQVIALMVAPTVLLIAMNVLHARLVIIQRDHYLGIDTRLRNLLQQPGVQWRTRRYRFASTHGLYCAMHLAVAIFLGIVALAMILYALGCFRELKVIKTANPGSWLWTG